MADTTGDHLKGIKLVLTGDLKSHERDQASRKLKALGADVTGSVSGKTTAVIAGENAGEKKLSEAKKRGLPVLSEAQFLALLAGKTLAEALAGATAASAQGGAATPNGGPAEKAPEPPKVPFPTSKPRPRDGVYTEHFEGTEKIRLQGSYVAGLKHGSWKRYYENGQVHEDYSYDRGFPHGPELDFYANGNKLCVGENRHGKRSGEWKWYYESGAYSYNYIYDDRGNKHGAHIWDLEDGQPRARGQFEDDKRHDHWRWWHEPNHERMERGYDKDRFHGIDEAWFSGDLLAYRRTSVFGSKEGLEETFRKSADGKTTLAFRGEWKAGFPVGEHVTIDESGEETRLRYTCGLSEAAKAPAVREKVLKKLKKAKDHYDKANALEEGSSYSERAPQLLHLWREGHVKVPEDADLWELFGEVAVFLTGEEVAKFLTEIPAKDFNWHGSFLPYWPDNLDRIVMTVYARDPDPIDAIAPSLSKRMKNGVAFVQGRFGRKMNVSLKAEMATLAKKHLEQYGLGQSLYVPGEDGRITRQDIYSDFQRTETPLFAKFIAVFGTKDTWRAALKKKAEKMLDGGRLPFRMLRPVIETATPEEMVKYISAIYLDNDTHTNILEALTKWRSDDAETLTKIALGVNDTGLRKWPACCAAILALHKEGKSVPQELVTALPFASESPTYTSSWYTDPLQGLTDEQKRDTAYFVERFPIEPGCAVPRMKLLREALAVLPKEVLKAKIEAQLAAEYSKSQVNQYLYLVDDPELWERAMQVNEKDSYGAYDGNIYGFGDLGEAGLPLLKRFEERVKGKAWNEAIAKMWIVALARTITEKGTFAPEYDKHVSFDAIAKDYDYRSYEPFLHRIVHLLPADRAEPILLGGLGSKVFSRAFRMIGSHPTEPVLHKAFTELCAREDTLKSEDQQNVGKGIGSLHDARAWVKWLFQSGAGGGMENALREGLGYPALDEVRKELTESGVEKPAEIDHVEKVRRRAESEGGGDQRIYLLRRIDEEPKEDLNRIGGPAPGVGAERWPKHDGEPMVHLFTLDLDTMPELRAQAQTDDGGEARSISVFCSNPDSNKAYSADTDETAVIVSSRAQVAAEAAVPEDAELMDAARFEPVAIQVPSSVWGARSDLHTEIYRSAGRALGEPLWLQDEEHFGDFLCQFDESFVHMNLGDSGIMYVFSDAAFWQCH